MYIKLRVYVDIFVAYIKYFMWLVEEKSTTCIKQNYGNGDFNLAFF